MPNLRVSSVHDSTVVEISLACTVFAISSMCDRSGAGDSQDFCVSAKARRRGRSLQTQKEREDDERRFALRTVTNGSAGPSSRVPNVSRAVTIGWMSAHITRPISNSFAGFFMLSGLTSQTIRVAQNRSSETITHVIYYRPSYENNIFRMNTILSICAPVCVALCGTSGNYPRKRQYARVSARLWEMIEQFFKHRDLYLWKPIRDLLTDLVKNNSANVTAFIVRLCARKKR